MGDFGDEHRRYAEGLARRLEAAGVSVRYVPLAGVGHIGILLA